MQQSCGLLRSQCTHWLNYDFRRRRKYKESLRIHQKRKEYSQDILSFFMMK